jgi:hypothetical protein
LIGQHSIKRLKNTASIEYISTWQKYSDKIQSNVDNTRLYIIHINMTKTYNQRLTVHSCIEYIFLFNNNIFLFKMLVTFLLQKPKLLMKYFILVFS